MDLLYLHYVIAREYNRKRIPVLERFVQNYKGEIKYVFSEDYVLEVRGNGLALGLVLPIKLNSP